MNAILPIAGRKSKGGGGAGGVEAPNTLRSNARARFVELLGEGEIGGVASLEDVFFDETPVRNADGTFNFKGVTWEQRKGLPDQPHLKGVKGVETPVPVDVRVRASTGPVVRSIVEDDVDDVRIVVRIPALFVQDKQSGNMLPGSVHYAIDVRTSGGSWVEVVNKNIINEKCVSPVQIAHTVSLPEDGAPWDVRVRRITPDSEEVHIQNETWFESLTKIVRGKFTYPNSALVAFELDAEKFGNSVPSRIYKVRGLNKIQIPVNFNPKTRTYTGIWNGNFKLGFTDDPAWVFYDLITNDRYGLGEFVDATKIDKWSLYQISQYCAQKVPSGYRDAAGNPILEPRYTFNGVINSRQRAFEVLQQIASAWRGMAYWSLGQVFATADMPADPVKLVAPADVIGGHFNYSGTSLKARHTAVVVVWNDPDDFGRPTTELIVDRANIVKYGWREKKVVLWGCNSRGMAHRMGRWILDSERHETETVEYQASWDHAGLVPGDIIAIADPNKAMVRAGGRIVEVLNSNQDVILDAPFEATPGETYSLMVERPNGTIITQAIQSFGVAGNPARLRLTAALPTGALANSMFIITGTDIVPRQYRVLSVKETEPHIFTIQALFHDPTKYARIEEGVELDPPPYSRPRNLVGPPTNLFASESYYLENGRTRARITLSWTPAPDFMSNRFAIEVRTPDGGRQPLGETAAHSIDINNTVGGTYRFYVTAIGYNGARSIPVEYEFAATGWSGMPMPFVSNLELEGDNGSHEFSGRNPVFTWLNNFPVSASAFADPVQEKISPLFKENVVRIYDVATNTLLRTEYVTVQNYTYTFEKNKVDNQAYSRGPSRNIRVEVAVRDVYNRQSDFVTLTVNNPVPAMIVPALIPGIGFAFAKWEQPEDLDFRGTLVWVSTSSSFDPLSTPPTYDGPNTSLTIPLTPGVTVWVRIAAYDAFGKTGLNISPPIEVTPLDSSVDFVPPGVPTGLALTSSVTTLPDGGSICRLVANWNPVADTDFSRYEIELKEGSGNFVAFFTNSTSYEWTVRSGLTYQARIRARDHAGNVSAFSSTVSHVAAADTTPPAVPTNFTATGIFSAIWLKWDANTESDFSHYEIYVHTAATPAPTLGTAATFTLRSNFFAHQDLPFDATRHYWIRAVDTSGNRSAWSARVQATTQSVVDTTPPAIPTGLTLTSSVDTLPGGAIVCTLKATWTASAAPDLSHYEIELREGAGNFVAFFTTSTEYSWSVRPGVTFTARIRARDYSGNASGFSANVNHTAGSDTVAPAVPTNVTANPTFSSVWLNWTPNGESDLSHYEIYVHTAATPAPVAATAASYECASSTFVHTNLPVNTTRHYWVRAVDTSGNKSAWSARVQATTKAIAAGDLAVGSIETYVATVGTAFIDSAHIVDLDAAKLRAGTVIAGSVLVGGDSLETVRSRAADPASRINAAATLIQPGKIQISGATTLASWRNGGDNTKIEGGAIAANTVTANSLVVGLRGLTIAGLQFSFNKATSVLSWSAGTIIFVNDAGNTQTVNIAADSAAWTSGTLYVSWEKGATTLSTATTLAAHAGSNWVRMATYRGGSNLVANYGRTLIDGANIHTNSILAEQLAAGSIEAYVASVNTAFINSANIIDLDAAKLRAGTVIAGSILIGSETLETVRSRAADPASRINAAATLIQPGKIQISGTTTLASWRNGGDNTKIEGGAIAANTIAANALYVGLRGLTITDLQFSFNASNQLSWTAGTISFVNDAGSTQTVSISSGSVNWTSGTLYVAWQKGATSLSTSTNIATHSGANWVRMATYKGGSNLVANYGRTIIDGANILADSIGAVQIQSGSILSTHIASNQIVSQHIGANQITARHILIKNMTNMLLNADFENESGTLDKSKWLDDNVYVDIMALSTGTPPTRFGVRFSPAATASILNYTDFISARAGETFTFDAYYTTTGAVNGSLVFQILCYDKDGNYLSVGPTSSISSSSGSWVMTSHQLKIPDNLTACAQIKPRIYTTNAHTSGNWWICLPFLRRASDGTLITDGAIETRHITVDSLEGDRIKTNSLNANRLMANTIDATRLVLGLRGVTASNIAFTPNSPSNNSVSWSAGQIHWINNAGNPVSTSVSASNATWSSGILYIYWARAATSLSTTTSAAEARAGDNVLIATYRGGSNLVVHTGRTIIDGNSIKTGSIVSNHLTTGVINTSELFVNGVVITNVIANNAASISGSAGPVGSALDVPMNTATTIQTMTLSTVGGTGTAVTVFNSIDFSMPTATGDSGLYHITIAIFRNTTQIYSKTSYYVVPRSGLNIRLTVHTFVRDGTPSTGSTPYSVRITHTNNMGVNLRTTQRFMMLINQKK